MFGKRGRIVFAVLWGLLLLPAGFFAMVLWGLARMDAGWVRPEPQLVVLWVLPFVLLISSIAEIFAARGIDTPIKQTLAKAFVFLPIGILALLAVLILIR